MRGSSALRQARHRDRVEPEPPPGIPDCPDWLDDGGREKWNQLVPLLHEMKVLARIDGEAVAKYCHTFSKWLRLELFLRDKGDVFPVHDAGGKIISVKVFPQVWMANKLLVVLQRYEAEFGLTPRARTRIHLPATSPADAPLEAFLAGQRPARGRRRGPA